MKCAVVVVHDPCNVMLDFPQVGVHQPVPYTFSTVQAEVFDALLPELFLEQVRQHLGVFPAWVDVMAYDGQRWRFLGDTLDGA